MRQTALKMVHELARRDPRVVFIGSDLGAGTLDAMKAELPERFFMEGVSEAAVIGMAAGLAMEGFIPYVNTIATFLTRRCFEQVAIDVCLHELPVRLLASGGGAVYAPLGPTHVALEDIAILRALPHMSIVAPCDADEMRRLMEASLGWPGPLYVRLAKGGDRIVSRAELGFAIGRAIPLREPGRVLFVSTGVLTQRALDAATLLRPLGVEAGVLHVHTVKPLDDDAILERAAQVELVVTLEEHQRTGGLGSAIAELFADRRQKTPLSRVAFADAFLEDYGSQDHLLTSAGLDVESIVRRTLESLDGSPR